MKADGRFQRPLSPGADDRVEWLRPAILPSDVARRPTEYALYGDLLPWTISFPKLTRLWRRFGIHPSVPDDSVGHSQMTPISSRPQDRDVELEEGYQSFVLNGYTTEEVGALHMG